MITKGLGDGTIVTRGFGSSNIPQVIWNELVKFTLLIKRITSFTLER